MSDRIENNIPASSRFQIDGKMPKYWPPKPNRFLNHFLKRFDNYYAKKYWNLKDVHIEGAQSIFESFGPHDSILIAPNHSHEGDPHVLLEMGKLIKRQIYFMAAWQTFMGHGGVDGWFLQKMGCFSVDREGNDKRAIKEAINLLTSQQVLVIFPEGEIHRLNDRLQPLLEGVSFMALNAQQRLSKENEGHVWILPCLIKYEVVGNPTKKMDRMMSELEGSIKGYQLPSGVSLEERIYSFGRELLTLKEQEIFGRNYKDIPELSERIMHDIQLILSQAEQEYFSDTYQDDDIPKRVKNLRRKLLDLWTDEAQPEEVVTRVLQTLDHVQVALQMFSYPGDYVKESPSDERMCETIEKFREDLFGTRKNIEKRNASLKFAEPMDMKAWLSASSKKDAMADITNQIEVAIKGLMKAHQ